ncbi:MAG: phosphatase PAP2 family protein [Gammaproteobacteria bacterium]|nr:phosphatase PAP2 family protein [Gammaproteobacteria bacterium]
MKTTVPSQFIVTVLLAWIASVLTAQAAEPVAPARSLGTTIGDDYRSFYSGPRLLRLGVAFGIGAIVANTSIDEEVHDWYQDDLRGDFSDDLGEVAKEFGEAKYLLPAVVLAAGLDTLVTDNEFTGAIGRFGRRTGRAYLVGLPALLALQRLTGASRPGEDPHPSHWEPFADDNGVSGHAFGGAVPLLTIARMNDDRPAVRVLFHLLSALPAWSRVNDASHFSSQAMLGWYLGYESVAAIADTDRRTKLTIAPMPWPGGAALIVGARF